MPALPSNEVFDTAPFFTGGAGMFITYYDVVKPVYFYAVIKLMVTNESYGLPIDIIRNMSISSLVEWYKNRRYVNPFQQLDWAHQIPPEELDKLLDNVLMTDPTIFKLCPALDVSRMFQVYKSQHMAFPVYVYTVKYNPYIEDDIKKTFNGINTTYLHGDMKKAIRNCDQNFTYIFNDIELLTEAADILMGTFSHLLLASDYRYNYKDYNNTFKHDLKDIMTSHPFLRLGTTHTWDSVSPNSFRLILNYKS